MKYCFVTAHCSLIVAVMTVLPGCSQSASDASAGDGKSAAVTAPPPALVRVAIIEKRVVTPEFRAVGTVRPRHMSIVASGADGIVEKFPVEDGDFVSEGTLLSKLRDQSTDLEIAEQNAVLAEREAELDEISNPREEDKVEAQARKLSAGIIFANAKRRLEELTALQIRGAANPSEVKDAQDTLDAAEQTHLAAIAAHTRISNARPETIRQAKARVDAQTQRVAFLQSEKEKRTTKAPITGFVVQEHTYVGQWLSKGAPVVTLAELTEVEIEVQIDQQYIDQISPKQKVMLKVQGTGSRDGLNRVWPGEVDSVVPRSNWQNGSRSFPVIVLVHNEINESSMPPVPALREGMMAEATFQGEGVDGVLVPKDSMVRTSRGSFIYVINPPV
ncbi:MAG: HlyD family efflux transporter periplasmic adaptor subunit, partial [Planctomycetota bacterium]|nr:HlyD family efflux transporter periplasmic adaptor subunit [Planctomycetota bacterium]